MPLIKKCWVAEKKKKKIKKNLILKSGRAALILWVVNNDAKSTRSWKSLCWLHGGRRRVNRSDVHIDIFSDVLIANQSKISISNFKKISIAS